MLYFCICAAVPIPLSGVAAIVSANLRKKNETAYPFAENRSGGLCFCRHVGCWAATGKATPARKQKSPGPASGPDYGLYRRHTADGRRAEKTQARCPAGPRHDRTSGRNGHRQPPAGACGEAAGAAGRRRSEPQADIEAHGAHLPLGRRLVARQVDVAAVLNVFELA